MPQSISFRTDRLFGDSTLPAIPYTLTGAPAARARFLATIGTTNDSAVTSWTSLDGAVKMAPTGTSTAPGKSTINGYTVARFNGTSSQLQADLAQSRPHSFAVAFFVHALPSTPGIIVGGQVNVGTDPALHDSGLLSIGDATAGSPWIINAGTNGSWGTATTGWHVAVVSFDATTTTGRIDGVETTRDIGQVPRKIITLGGHRGGNYAHISVAELVVWDGGLTSDQMTSIEASMRDHYNL